MKKGFTLVELSIVLVIIGLLIGGVLVAQSMTGTAKVTAQISQLQQFDAGVMNFRTKFNAIPGDAVAFGGDGDNAIESHNAATIWNDFLTAHSGEVASFWSQVFPDEYRAGTYTSGGALVVDVMSFSGANKTAPAAKIGKKNSGFYASTYATAGSTRGTNTDNYYSITEDIRPYDTTGGVYRITTSAAGNKTLMPAELLAIDAKTDDSLANAGSVRSGSYVANYGVPMLTGVATCSTGANYLVTNNTYECVPFFRIGAQAGYPQ